MTKIRLLNSSILTNYGTFEYSPIKLGEAQRLLQKNEYESAIGHSSTADILSELLQTKIEVNRIEYCQLVNDIALIFKLRSRPPEGKILNRAEIEEIGYDFGILRRLK